MPHPSLILLGLITLAPLAVPDRLSAQAPTSPNPSPTVVTTDRYLFVVRGDQVFQFDVHTLRLLNATTLPETVPAAAAIADAVAEAPAEPIEAEPRPRAKEFESEAIAIDAGLLWLVAHQDADGKWNADEFMAHDATGEPSDGPGSAVHDVGLTGVALLALLGGGNTMRAGPHQESIKRGILWLREQQDPESGLFGTPSSGEFIYDHAIATLAVVEAYGLSDYKILKKNAQRGIDYLERHRNPYSVWRYQPRDGDNDTSVTTWCVMAYAAARDHGLEVNLQALELAATWIDSMTDPETGRTGYTERGGLSSRRVGDSAVRFPPDASEAMTAAALFCRCLLGPNQERSLIMLKQADLILAKPPQWDAEHRKIDPTAWWFGSMALYQIGGRHWQRWSRHLRDAVLGSQRRDGNAAGSWDPIDAWGEDGGRIYATAMMTMALETHFRFTRLVR